MEREEPNCGGAHVRSMHIEASHMNLLETKRTLMLRFSYRLFILIVNCSLFILNNLTAVHQSYLFSIMCFVLILFLQGGERERGCVFCLQVGF